MIDAKKVNELLDAIIEIKDKLSWEKLDSTEIYKARFPNGDYFMIDICDSEDNHLCFGEVYKLFYNKWLISSADYPKIADLVKIADKYLQEKEDEEAEQYFNDLKSLVHSLRSKKNKTIGNK